MAVDLEESNKDYKDEISAVKSVLDSDEYTSTPKVAEKTGALGHKEDYWRYQLLPGVLSYLRDSNDIEREKRHEGGEATHYWRLKNNE